MVVGREGGRREGDHQSLRPPPPTPSSTSSSFSSASSSSRSLPLRLLSIYRVFLSFSSSSSSSLSFSHYSYLPTPFPSFRPLSPSSHPSTPSPRAAQSALSPFSVPLSFFRSPFALSPPRRPAPPICELHYRLPSPVPCSLSPSVCLVSSFPSFIPSHARPPVPSPY